MMVPLSHLSSTPPLARTDPWSLRRFRKFRKFRPLCFMYLFATIVGYYYRLSTSTHTHTNTPLCTSLLTHTTLRKWVLGLLNNKVQKSGIRVMALVAVAKKLMYTGG